MAEKRKHDDEDNVSKPLTEGAGGNGGAAEGASPSAPTDEECRELLAQKENELKQEKDRFLRLAADLENTRRRLEREASEGMCYANESLLREMLPALDNLERAIEHSEKEADYKSLLEGVRMTAKGFLDALAKFGCKPVEALGKNFDPNYHEAMMQQENPDRPENEVLLEVRKGYTLNERLLRPSMVVVSKKPKQ
jgi:molecular chaperone GrpE